MSAPRTGEFARGIRWAVTWLHDSAKGMNDPHAKALLNGAAFNMGSDAAEAIARAIVAEEKRATSQFARTT